MTNGFLKEQEGIYRLKVPFEDLYTSVFLVETPQRLILVDCATTDDDVELLARQLERCMEVIDVKCDGGDDWEFISREMLKS